MAEHSPTGHFRILYFASAASFARKTSDDFPAPLRVSELFRFLESKYPGINKKVLCSCAVTVNLDYVDVEDDQVSHTLGDRPRLVTINEGDEVAIIPPVSSG